MTIESRKAWSVLDLVYRKETATNMIIRENKSGEFADGQCKAN